MVERGGIPESAAETVARPQMCTGEILPLPFNFWLPCVHILFWGHEEPRTIFFGIVLDRCCTAIELGCCICQVLALIQIFDEMEAFSFFCWCREVWVALSSTARLPSKDPGFLQIKPRTAFCMRSPGALGKHLLYIRARTAKKPRVQTKRGAIPNYTYHELVAPGPPALHSRVRHLRFLCNQSQANTGLQAIVLCGKLKAGLDDTNPRLLPFLRHNCQRESQWEGRKY